MSEALVCPSCHSPFQGKPGLSCVYDPDPWHGSKKYPFIVVPPEFFQKAKEVMITVAEVVKERKTAEPLFPTPLDPETARREHRCQYCGCQEGQLHDRACTVPRCKLCCRELGGNHSLTCPHGICPSYMATAEQCS